jgi:hypothetical protein
MFADLVVTDSFETQFSTTCIERIKPFSARTWNNFVAAHVHTIIFCRFGAAACRNIRQSLSGRPCNEAAVTGGETEAAGCLFEASSFWSIAPAAHFLFLFWDRISSAKFNVAGIFCSVGPCGRLFFCSSPVGVPPHVSSGYQRRLSNRAPQGTLVVV